MNWRKVLAWDVNLEAPVIHGVDLSQPLNESVIQAKPWRETHDIVEALFKYYEDPTFEGEMKKFKATWNGYAYSWGYLDARNSTEAGLLADAGYCESSDSEFGDDWDFDGVEEI